MFYLGSFAGNIEKHYQYKTNELYIGFNGCVMYSVGDGIPPAFPSAPMLGSVLTNELSIKSLYPILFHKLVVGREILEDSINLCEFI